MSRPTREELSSKINAIIGDRTDDDALSVLEMVDDLYASIDQDDSENWRQKYEDNNREWARRYRERFNSPVADDDDGDTGITPETITINDLFKH